MFVPIFFGIVSSIVIYTILRGLLADYEGFNIWISYTHAVILILIAGIILIFKSRLVEVFWNVVYWNTFLIANFGIAVLIFVFVFFKVMSARKR